MSTGPNPTAALASIRKAYGDKVAVRDVSLTVEASEIVVIVGANGSGKTTSMEILTGLRTPDTGSVEILGQPVVPGGAHRLAVGVQLQESGLPQGIRVDEAVQSKAVLYADPGPVDDIIKGLGLNEYWRNPVDKLSGGWQRRLDIALACIGRPSLVVLDEPTSGVDPVGRAAVWDFLRRLRAAGTAILAATHDLSEAEAYADRLVVIDRGQVSLSGTVSEVLDGAGGEWRVRLTGVDDAVLGAVRALGLSPLPLGDGITALGEREAITSAAERLEALRDAGSVTFKDILRGPVRLEDVFAAIVERNAS